MVLSLLSKLIVLIFYNFFKTSYNVCSIYFLLFQLLNDPFPLPPDTQTCVVHILLDVWHSVGAWLT